MQNAEPTLVSGGRRAGWGAAARADPKSWGDVTIVRAEGELVVWGVEPVTTLVFAAHVAPLGVAVKVAASRESAGNTLPQMPERGGEPVIPGFYRFIFQSAESVHTRFAPKDGVAFVRLYDKVADGWDTGAPLKTQLPGKRTDSRTIDASFLQRRTRRSMHGLRRFTKKSFPIVSGVRFWRSTWFATTANA
jgi:hypothetical protein